MTDVCSKVQTNPPHPHLGYNETTRPKRDPRDARFAAWSPALDGQHGLRYGVEDEFLGLVCCQDCSIGAGCALRIMVNNLMPLYAIG